MTKVSLIALMTRLGIPLQPRWAEGPVDLHTHDMMYFYLYLYTHAHLNSLRTLTLGYLHCRALYNKTIPSAPTFCVAAERFQNSALRNFEEMRVSPVICDSEML